MSSSTQCRCVCMCACKYFFNSFSWLKQLTVPACWLRNNAAVVGWDCCVKRRVNAPRGNVSSSSLAKQTATEEKLLLWVAPSPHTQSLFLYRSIIVPSPIMLCLYWEHVVVWVCCRNRGHPGGLARVLRLDCLNQPPVIKAKGIENRCEVEWVFMLV